MKDLLEYIARLNRLNLQLSDIYVQSDDLGAEQAITFMLQMMENSDSIRAALDAIFKHIKES